MRYLQQYYSTDVVWVFRDTERSYEGLLITPKPEQEGNKLQRPNSVFIQYTPHEAQYTS